MAGLRKGRCYREIERAYTRKSKFRSKGFVKAIPPNKIIKYNMGNAKKEFPANKSVLCNWCEYQKMCFGKNTKN